MGWGEATRRDGGWGLSDEGSSSGEIGGMGRREVARWEDG